MPTVLLRLATRYPVLLKVCQVYLPRGLVLQLLLPCRFCYPGLFGVLSRRCCWRHCVVVLALGLGGGDKWRVVSHYSPTWPYSLGRTTLAEGGS